MAGAMVGNDPAMNCFMPYIQHETMVHGYLGTRSHGKNKKYAKSWESLYFASSPRFRFAGSHFGYDVAFLSSGLHSDRFALEGNSAEMLGKHSKGTL